MANIRFLQQTIYNLKKDYGEWMNLYVVEQSIVDLTTGQQSLVKKNVRIKGVVITNVTAAQILHLFPLLVGSKHTAYSPTLDNEKVLVVIETKDIPKGLQLTTSHYVVYFGQKYQIQQIGISEHKVLHVLTLIKQNTQQKYEIFDLRANNCLQYQQSVGSV